jgi:single-strand DNA-binding protein
LNKVILIGRLTRDPEVRYTQGAEPMAIARYSLAVNRRFKKEGQPEADFLNCVAFGRNGEFAEKFLKKGMQMAVQLIV